MDIAERLCQYTETTKYVIEGQDWQEGTIFTEMYSCQTLQEWSDFVKSLQTVTLMNMSFRLRERNSGKILGKWRFDANQ